MKLYQYSPSNPSLLLLWTKLQIFLPIFILTAFQQRSLLPSLLSYNLFLIPKLEWSFQNMSDYAPLLKTLPWFFVSLRVKVKPLMAHKAPRSWTSTLSLTPLLLFTPCSLHPGDTDVLTLLCLDTCPPDNLNDYSLILFRFLPTSYHFNET